MLKTSLKIYGFWIGMIIGDSCLVLMQLFYLLKINWKSESEIVKSCLVDFF
jgi:Na+-driven multidrug efflux pump